MLFSILHKMLQIFKNIEINENIGTAKLKSELFTPAGNCMFKVNNRITRTRYEICQELTIKTLEQRQWRQWHLSRVFIVNTGYISHFILVFQLLTTCT